MCCAPLWPLSGKGPNNADLSTFLGRVALVGRAGCRWILRSSRHLGWEGWEMNDLQILYLRRLHGLTEAQAHALAVLIWGVS